MRELAERAGVRGDITITVIEEATGRVVRRMEIRNLIVTRGLESIGLLLKGFAVANDVRRLGQLQVGIGGTSPVTGNTGIQTPPSTGVTTCPVTTTVTVLANQVEVKCTATLSTAQANGNSISEAALFTLDASGASPVLFARQIFLAVPKTVALSILFDWRVTFTA